MHAHTPTVRHLPPRELADYDFLRATYEALLRASRPDAAAIDAAFDALDAAHARLRAAHEARRQVGEAIH